ncbi:class I adenylate-forming enzyme family protein [Micromonospora sp. WMMD723]|uniref:class I adenylate-forming enzyme family protein n=1 Tax=unclassified Micromonospora TaxID=2617518 RepID=UPI003B95DEEA
MTHASWWGDPLLDTGADRLPWLISRTAQSRAELRSAVTELNRELAGYGIGNRSTVMVRMAPSVTYLHLMLALWSRGAQVILVDFRSTPTEYEPLTRLLDPQFLIVSPEPTGPVAGLHDDVAFQVHRRASGVPASSDACLVQFSSGSTGRPKVIGRTPASLLAEIDRHVALDRLPRAGERLLVLNSIVHTMGLVTGVLYALHVGATVVLAPNTRPAEVLRLARDTGVAAVYGVPAHIELLTRVGEVPPLPDLRLVLSGGERLPLDVYESFHRQFGVPVSQVYGVTETGLLVAGLDGPRPPVVGMVVPGVEAKLVDQELYVRCDASPYVFDDQPDRYVDGWLRTYDRFAMSGETGELSMLGRSDSLVIIRGLKLDLTEVESVVLAHPRVSEAVVTYGEVIEAFVAGENPPDQAELTRWCYERLSLFKVPKRFVITGALPRNKTGKVVRNRTMIMEQLQIQNQGAGSD